MRHIKHVISFSQRRNLSSLAKGPDRLIPTEAIYTWKADGAVKIQEEKSGETEFEPLSLPTAFRRTVEKCPNYPVLIFKRDGQEKKWTYTQYYTDVEIAAKALIRLGLERHHGVCNLGFNAPQWMLSMLGTIFAGGLGTGAYITSSPDICKHIGQNCRVNVFVVENDVQVQKILSIREQLPHLKAIVQYIGKPSEPGVLSWEDFMALGRDAPDSILKERLDNMAVNQAAVIGYTSGTTGVPKGALISHDNIIFASEAVKKIWMYFDDNTRVLSYLPLNHIAGMFPDIFFPLVREATVYFGRPDVFQGSLIDSLKEARPTFSIAVPRILEKIYENLLPTLPNGEKLSEEKRMEILESVGLDKCSLLGTGAAPSNPDILRFFENVLKLPPMNAYGLTEAGIVSLQNPTDFNVQSVGKFFSNYKFDNPDEDGDGELLLKGRNLFMGYLDQKEKTLETIDEEGWLRTGDIGRVDAKGFLFITGRCKEIIITSGGENIPPVEIENTIKQELPVLSNCMVIGDQRKYLTALITLRTEMDPSTGELRDELQPDVVEWCKSIGSDAKTLSDILHTADNKVFQEIQNGFDRANSKAMSRPQKVQKWTLLSTDFTMAGEELGPTLKLRRHYVHQKYEHIIDAMYKE